MATNTKNYNFKKPDESDFYDIQDQNGNWDIADEKMEELSAPTFEDYSGTTSVPEASTAIEAIKSKKKIPEILANIKAAFKGVCLLGHIVNNCVTDNAKLPLSAAQGKALMDQITKLNGDLDSTRNFFVFKTASQKNITAGETGFWHEKIKIPSGYKVLYVSATYNNADSCMLTSYDATITCIGNTSDIEPWFGFYATRTGTGTFTAYAVCVKI